MVDENKIKEAAKSLRKDFDDDITQGFLVEFGFEKGAKWAVNELNYMNKEYTKRLIQKAEETIKSLCKIYEYFRIIISMLTLYFAILYNISNFAKIDSSSYWFIPIAIMSAMTSQYIICKISR